MLTKSVYFLFSVGLCWSSAQNCQCTLGPDKTIESGEPTPKINSHFLLGRAIHSPTNASCIKSCERQTACMPNKPHETGLSCSTNKYILSLTGSGVAKGEGSRLPRLAWFLLLRRHRSKHNEGLSSFRKTWHLWRLKKSGWRMKEKRGHCEASDSTSKGWERGWPSSSLSKMVAY